MERERVRRGTSVLLSSFVAELHGPVVNSRMQTVAQFLLMRLSDVDA